jgi:CRP-like cAMP-binding protein
VATKTIEQLIRQNELFRDLDEKETQALLALLCLVSYPEQALIFQENSRKQGLYVIQQGDVELYRSSPLRDKQQLVILGPNQILSEHALLTQDGAHTASARSLSPATLLLLDRDGFQKLAASHPGAALKIMTRVAGVLYRRHGQIDDLRGIVWDGTARYLQQLPDEKHVFKELSRLLVAA